MVENNLQKYDIFIDKRDLIELKSDIWNEDPVMAYMRINGNRYSVDIVYRGAHTRNKRKKSYSITFNKPAIYAGGHEMHLNAEYFDLSLMRNKLSLDFFGELGVLSPTSKHVLLKINGRKEGIYLHIDSVDEFFLKKRNLPEGSIFYAVDDDANFSLISSFEEGPKASLELGYEQKCGKSEDKKKLAEFIYAINVTNRIDFQSQIEAKLNIEQYLLWLTGVVCTQNYDGFVHNYALYLNNDTGRFEIMPWDYDATWGRDVNGREMPHNYVRIEGFNTLSARLLDLPIYRDLYHDIMKKTLQSYFTVDYMEPIIMNLHNKLLPWLKDDPFMKKEIHQFKKEPIQIIEFIKDRQVFLWSSLDQLRKKDRQ